MQAAYRPDVGQNPFGIHGLVGIQRAAVTFRPGDKGVVIVRFGALHLSQAAPVAGQLGVQRGRSQAPGAAQRVIFQPGAGLFGQDERVFAVAVFGRVQPGDHSAGQRNPVLVRGAGAALLPGGGFQQVVGALPGQVPGVAGGVHAVKPPAAVVPACGAPAFIQQAGAGGCGRCRQYTGWPAAPGPGYPAGEAGGRPEASAPKPKARWSS